MSEAKPPTNREIVEASLRYIKNIGGATTVDEIYSVVNTGQSTSLTKEQITVTIKR